MFLQAISQGFVAEKRHEAMQESFIKKKEKKEKKLETKVSEIFKTKGI